MKTVWMMVTCLIVVVVSAGLTGCRKEKDTPPVAPVDVVEQVEQDAPAVPEAPAAPEAPATAKPKDHPAH